VYRGRRFEVGAVQDLELPGGAGRLHARHYAPRELGDPHPLLVFYHGGGFTYGDLDTHDGTCRLLCRHAGAHVLAIDYRLAPENPFPAAVEDARVALAWAWENAAALGADPSRVGVSGDSAGGNLAAVAAQLAARDGGPAPVLQLLIYPATDFTRRRRSRELFGEGFLLTNDEMDWFEANYLGEARTHAGDPRASPLLAQDLSGLAPAFVVTAAFDPLRDEGEEYARALRAAGTPATVRRFPGFIHAFVAAAGVSRPARDAVIEIAGVTRGMFAATGTGRASAGTLAGTLLGGVTLGGAGASLRRLGVAILRRRRRLELFEQLGGGLRYRLDGTGEGRLVGARGLGKAADLAHVLERGCFDLLLGGGRIKVVEGSDVSAHASKPKPWPAKD
jgi:acetyl esterase